MGISVGSDRHYWNELHIRKSIFTVKLIGGRVLNKCSHHLTMKYIAGHFTQIKISDLISDFSLSILQIVAILCFHTDINCQCSITKKILHCIVDRITWWELQYEPVHEISNNVVCATSRASDQPVHTHSLIRVFASRLSMVWLLSYWLNTIWSFYA